MTKRTALAVTTILAAGTFAFTACAPTDPAEAALRSLEKQQADCEREYASTQRIAGQSGDAGAAEQADQIKTRCDELAAKVAQQKANLARAKKK